MSIPSGYEKLAVIGIAYKNDYEPEKEYGLLNAVYYSGSTYVALKENPAGPPVDDKVNWQYLAKGFVEGVMSAINVTDTSGVVGTAGEVANAQVFMDAMADRMLTKLLERSKIVNSLLASDPTTVLSGALGPIIDQRLTDLLNKYTQLNGEAFRKAIQDNVANTLSHTFKTKPSSNDFLWFILIKHPLNGTDDRTPSLLVISNNGNAEKCFYKILSDWINNISYQDGSITINYNVPVYSYASIFRITN